MAQLGWRRTARLLPHLATRMRTSKDYTDVKGISPYVGLTSPAARSPEHLDYLPVQFYTSSESSRCVVQVSVTEAKGQLTELVRRAEAGDEIILTRPGHPAVRLAPIRRAPDRDSRKALLQAVRASGAAKANPGPDAARSQDFLYGDDGLPR